jgi:hypothetical protein
MIMVGAMRRTRPYQTSIGLTGDFQSDTKHL